MSVENKIDRLIQEVEENREAAGPDYVTPEAAKAIDKAGIETPEQNDIEAPDLEVADEGPSHIAGILNKLGSAAEDAS